MNAAPARNDKSSRFESPAQATPPAQGTAKDAGWEVGVRETVSTPLPVVWQFLLGAGLPVWLGVGQFKPAKGFKYEMADGVRGEVQAYTEGSKIRISWRPDDWPHDTTLLVTVKESEAGTVIAIHHQELADRDERRMMLGHWKNVIGSIAGAF